MNVVFDGKIVPYDSFKLDIADRAFTYGDGLFETMFFQRGALRLLEYHLNRLTRGCRILGLKLPSVLDHKNLQDWSAVLSEHEGMDYRIKLMVWRSSGGRYTPESDQCHFMLEAHAMTGQGIETRQNMVVCESITNHQTEISPFKTLSSLKYVKAAQEMKAKGGDDIILLDNRGNVSEALYSNIFWILGKELYTPATTTGCIEGTMRQYILDRAGTNPIQEVMEPLETLLGADKVMLTNSLGVFPVSKILDKEFPDSAVPKLLQLP